ncbi:CGNR zinc finger domain-containing protein [Parasphingorhabdus pacifica]
MSSKGAAPATERPAAKADLDLGRDIDRVLAFLNTRDIEYGTDVLDDPAEWRRWCVEHGLAEPPEANAVRELRDAMREAARCDTFPDTLVTPDWPVHVTLDNGIPALTGTDALGSILTSAVRVVHTGHWERIKICPAEDCLMAFYDRSRNRSRTWCSMRVCGNREKARGWRERHIAK